MRYADDQDQAVRRLMLDWFNVAVLSVPIASAGVLGVRSILDLPLGLGYTSGLASRELWVLAATTMLAGIGGATWAGAWRFRPSALAEKVRNQVADREESLLATAETEIWEAQFAQHRILDLPGAIFLGYGFIYNDDVALALSIVYSAVAFILTRPDEERILRDTMLSLKR